METQSETSLLHATKKIVHYNGYRTVSFFGFNAPNQLPHVKHFHTVQADLEQSKYIPIRRSKSLDDLFATERGLHDDTAFGKTILVGRIKKSRTE